MGYTLDTGTFGAILDNVVLCPHKTDEEGAVVGFIPTFNTVVGNSLSGILKPNDFGSAKKMILYFHCALS